MNQVFALYEFRSDHWAFEPIGYFWSKADADTALATMQSGYVEEIEITGIPESVSTETHKDNIVFITSVVSTDQWLAVNSTEQLARAHAELTYGVDTQSWRRYDFNRKALYGFDRDGDRIVIESVEVD